MLLQTTIRNTVARTHPPKDEAVVLPPPPPLVVAHAVSSNLSSIQHNPLVVVVVVTRTPTETNDHLPSDGCVHQTQQHGPTQTHASPFTIGRTDSRVCVCVRRFRLPPPTETEMAQHKYREWSNPTTTRSWVLAFDCRDLGFWFGSL